MGTEVLTNRLMAITPPPGTGLRLPARPFAIITFHYPADGTVTATCGPAVGRGRTEAEALQRVQAQFPRRRSAVGATE
jgi:hypothetical protein